ncbi:hypothetical protein BMS3Bbin06_00060 [bacterium BMS3Bbin06]|nr:hypothetical protein BMS3Abin08_02314 [bacterium BMS3Abin08]GBE33553.1 hypothetical protein BMS3Bbin06_00060 [bacterium BMS3Bbin06]
MSTEQFDGREGVPAVAILFLFAFLYANRFKQAIIIQALVRHHAVISYKYNEL